MKPDDDAAFDELLSAPANSGKAAEPAQSALAPREARAAASRELASPHAHTAAPSFDEFVAGWAVYRDAVLAGSAAGLVLGVLGVFIVLRRAVFVTAAVTQAAGLGVALAFFAEIHLALSLPPLLGAALASLAVSLSFALRAGRRAARETDVGIVYLAASALAVLVGDRIGQEAHDVGAILFGTAVLVRPVDLAAIAAVGACVLLALVVLGRGLVFTGFDPEGARVQGLPLRGLELTLWVLVALAAAVSARALGSLPAFAFAVLPAAGALAVARSMRSAWVVAGGIGALAGAAGYVAAFRFELPVGASQALGAGLLALLPATAGRFLRRS